MGAHPDVPDIAQASVPNQIAMKEGYSWMHHLIEFYHAAFRQHGLQMLHHFLLQTLLTKINNALWILNFTVTFRGKGINFRRVNEVSGDVSCSLWWNLGIWSFSVDRFNQLTTGGGWDKPVLVDVMSAGKLLGIASAATPNSTKKSLQHPLSLTIPARKSRIASLLMHTCYYKIILIAVDLLIFSPEITRSRKTIFWEKKHIIKVSIKS